MGRQPSRRVVRLSRVAAQAPAATKRLSPLDEGIGGSYPGIQERGYFVQYGATAPGSPRIYVDAARDLALSAQFEHQFCGPHEVAGTWCPNCERPLLRFLALDTRDSRLGLGEVPFATLSLFYCWPCPAAQGPFSYRVLDNGDVSLLQCERGAPETDFPYSEYPVYFPGAPARLMEITDEVQQVLHRFNLGEYDDICEHRLLKEDDRLLECRHQFGGEPLLIQQDTEYQLQCPTCEAPMPFLCSIGDDCLDARGFCENAYVQVIYHYCAPCRVIRAFQQCD
jgi:hypothetical protein